MDIVKFKDDLKRLDDLDLLLFSVPFEIWRATFVDTERPDEPIEVTYFFGADGADCTKQAVRYEYEWFVRLDEAGSFLKYGGLPKLTGVEYVTTIDIGLSEVAERILAEYEGYAKKRKNMP